MSAVQNINKEVSENTVLNGGDNKTEVEVNTTLEGDVVDRAIASAHRKVVELKKIAIIIIPVLLLITGGTMSSMDMFGSDDYNNEPDVHKQWGCTDPDATNYEDWANEDDESCDYHVYGCTNDAAPNYDDEATFDDGSCEPEPQPVYGCMDDEADNYDPEAEEDDGSCYYPPEPIEGCTDPEADNYNSDADTDDDSCEYPPNPDDCTVSIENHYRGHLNNNEYSDTMVVAFKVVPTDCDEFTLDVSIELFQQGQEPAYTKHYQLPGDTDHDINYAFENMSVATWTPKVRAGLMGEGKADVNFWALDIQEPPCEGSASFYNSSYSIDYNNTNNSSLANITVFWDADWSCDETHRVEIDIYLKFNNSTIYFDTRIFNLNGDSSYVANHTIYDIDVAKTYELCLAAWVVRDGTYYIDDTDEQNVSIS